MMNGHDESDSETVEDRVRLGRRFLYGDFPEAEDYEGPPVPEANPGDIVDAELVDGPDDPFTKDKEKPPPRERIKTTPPSADEWQDFFSRIILRTLSRWYISLVFRGIDEDELSDREIERLILTEEERRSIAQPWAEYASKDRYLRKHGRRVVALAGSIESFIVLGGWVTRVNRIAAKHRPPKVRVMRENVSSGQASPNGNPTGPIRPPEPGEGYTVYNPGTS